MSRALSLQELREYRLQLESLIDSLLEKAAEHEAETLQPMAMAGGNSDWMSAYSGDPRSHDAEEGVARVLLESEQAVLAEARAALSRLDAGTFGRCDRCGRHIGKARFDVVPYARHCIRCISADESVE